MTSVAMTAADCRLVSMSLNPWGAAEELFPGRGRRRSHREMTSVVMTAAAD